MIKKPVYIPNLDSKLKVYSDSEMEAFDKEIQIYLEGKDGRDGLNQWLVENNAIKLRDHGEIVVLVDVERTEIIDGREKEFYAPCKYKILMNRWDQWCEWKGKKARQLALQEHLDQKKKEAELSTVTGAVGDFW